MIPIAVEAGITGMALDLFAGQHKNGATAYPSTTSWRRSAPATKKLPPRTRVSSSAESATGRTWSSRRRRGRLSPAQGLVELAAELEAAFDRFLINPVKDDKLCRAKIAILQPSTSSSTRTRMCFKKPPRTSNSSQWAERKISAGPRRRGDHRAGAARGFGAVPVLIDALVDPQKDVRIAAAQALGYVGTGPAGLLLASRPESATARLRSSASAFRGS